MENLRDRDLNLWYEQQLVAIRNKDTTVMDWDNLVEEIEDMGAKKNQQ